jgi:hypothetical protein
MELELDRLPRNPEALIEIIRQQSVEIGLRDEKIYLLDGNRHKLSSENEKLKAENMWYWELIDAHNRMLFQRKSEKLSREELQYWLLNEAELCALPERSSIEPSMEVKAYKRHKRGRKPISDKLPRVLKEHKLSDSEKKCACCGKERPVLAPDIHEEVEMESAKVYVTQHVIEKAGSCDCPESKAAGEPPIVEAKCESRLIPGGIAAPSMLVCYGIDYPRETMCKQIIAASRGSVRG